MTFTVPPAVSPSVRLDLAALRGAMNRHRIANYPALAARLDMRLSDLNRVLVGREAPSALMLVQLRDLGVQLDDAVTIVDGDRIRHHARVGRLRNLSDRIGLKRQEGFR